LAVDVDQRSKTSGLRMPDEKRHSAVAFFTAALAHYASLGVKTPVSRLGLTRNNVLRFQS
jgi:hypothetical protein